MIFVDSSVWIAHLRDYQSAHVERLREELRLGSVIVGDLVLMEILQGLRNERSVRAVLQEFRPLPRRQIAVRGMPLRAAANYRRLRSLGFTPRNAVDTLIGTFCIANELSLLHNDRDFDPFEQHLGLKVVRVA